MAQAADLGHVSGAALRAARVLSDWLFDVSVLLRCPQRGRILGRT